MWLSVVVGWWFCLVSGCMGNFIGMLFVLWMLVLVCLVSLRWWWLYGVRLLFVCVMLMMGWFDCSFLCVNL